MAKDMLFATLDTTTRRIDLPDGQPLLITDTVGFVRNLPHRLVEAFKATLEEAVLADFLIHVLDATAPEIERFHDTTLEVLQELGAEDKPVITVLNKIDLVTDPDELAALDRKFPDALHLSAVTGLGLEDLLKACSEVLADRVRCKDYRIPQQRADLVSLLHREAKVLSTDYEGDDILVRAVVPPTIAGTARSLRQSSRLTTLPVHPMFRHPFLLLLAAAIPCLRAKPAALARRSAAPSSKPCRSVGDDDIAFGRATDDHASKRARPVDAGQRPSEPCQFASPVRWM